MKIESSERPNSSLETGTKKKKGESPNRSESRNKISGKKEKPKRRKVFYRHGKRSRFLAFPISKVKKKGNFYEKRKTRASRRRKQEERK